MKILKISAVVLLGLVVVATALLSISNYRKLKKMGENQNAALSSGPGTSTGDSGNATQPKTNVAAPKQTTPTVGGNVSGGTNQLS